jgi:hypothetical protein
MSSIVSAPSNTICFILLCIGKAEKIALFLFSSFVKGPFWTSFSSFTDFIIPCFLSISIPNFVGSFLFEIAQE